MRITIIVLLSFFCWKAAVAQSFGDLYTNGWETAEYVKKDISKKIKAAHRKGRVFESSQDQKGDTMIFRISDPYDGLTIRTYFGLTYKGLDDDRFCGFQEIAFDCTPCGDKHLQEIIEIWGFRQKSENVYLSSYMSMTEMTVKHLAGNDQCLVLEFRHVELPKKEYKRQYALLKK